jgi:predicted nucleic acid-binding protein
MQVFQEFYVKVSQKPPTGREHARAEMRDLMAWGPGVVDDAVLETGCALQDRYQLSFWDALIVAAAKLLSCRYLLTEDFQADQDLDGILVVNPFLCDPDWLSSR